MNYKELAEKAREIKAGGERFLAQYENEIVDFLREDAEDAESRLQKEIFFEFLDNLHGMCHLAEYMGLEVVKEGVLGLDSQGEMTLDGDIPSIKRGNKYIINMDALLAYLNGETIKEIERRLEEQER